MRYLAITLFSLFLLTSLANAKPSPDDFGTLPAVHDIAISPDGKNLALFVNYKGHYAIRVVSSAGKDEGVKLTKLAEGSKPSWIKWANNKRVLAGLWESQKRRLNPIKVTGLYSIDTRNMDGKYLIKPRNMYRQYNDEIIDFLENDPDHILMGFSDKRSTFRDIHKVNVTTGKYTLIKKGRNNIQQWFTDNRGEPRIGKGRTNNGTGKRNMIIRDTNSGKWRDVSEYPGLKASTDVKGFTDDPNELVVAMYNKRDTKGLYIYNLSLKQISQSLFHNEEYDVGGVIRNQEGIIIGAKFTSDVNERVLFDGFDSIMNKMQEKFAGSNVDFYDRSKGAEKTVFLVSSASNPGQFYLYDKTNDHLTQIASKRPKLLHEEMGHVLSAKYEARDGVSIPAYMTVPPSISRKSEIQKLPFIILPHGGPYSRKSKRFDYFAQFFATRGYGVYQMNFRGSTGYGKSFTDAGKKNWVVMQEDVEDATLELIRNGYADHERICIAGWSYGGYAALIGGIKNPELYKCVISIAGVSDLQEKANDMRRYRSGITRARDFLDGFEDNNAVIENSPLKRAREITAPVFLAHGKNDTRVHFDQFSRMEKALKMNKTELTSLAFDKEDHFMSNQNNRIKMFNELDKFLASHLGKSKYAD